MWFALLMLLIPSILVSAEITPEWIPAALILPKDMRIVSSREIGDSVRMLTFTTGVDLAALLSEWGKSLKSSGYAVEIGRESLGVTPLLFSGGSILNAQIIARPQPGEKRASITIDATLD